MFKFALNEKTAKHTCEAKYSRTRLLGVLKRHVTEKEQSLVEIRMAANVVKTVVTEGSKQWKNGIYLMKTGYL